MSIDVLEYLRILQNSRCSYLKDNIGGNEMRFQGIPVTLENYKEIFRDCIPDVLDEIRLAVLDDTNIIPYIDACGSDSYKLGQFRLAIREGVPTRFLSVKLTARAVYCIRRCFANNISLEPLVKYYNGTSIAIPVDIFEMIAETLSLGGDITQIDFYDVKDDILEIICKGLVRGYPMQMFVDDRFTQGYIRLLMRGLDLCIDINPFMEDIWEEDQLITIFASSSKIDISLLMQYVSPKFPCETISSLIKIMSNGLDIDRLAYRDSDGYPIYSNYQIEVLGIALEMMKNGINCEDVFNPKLSDKQMEDMLDDIKNSL